MLTFKSTRYDCMAAQIILGQKHFANGLHHSLHAICCCFLILVKMLKKYLVYLKFCPCTFTTRALWSITIIIMASNFGTN